MAAPTIIQAADVPWETWRDPAVAGRSPVRWKDLIGRERAASQALSLGVAEIPPGATLARHRHAAPEIYYLLSGAGSVEVDGKDYPATAGSAIFARIQQHGRGYDRVCVCLSRRCLCRSGI
jgi:quercetin dioxygenase-like cupin family protein